MGRGHDDAVTSQLQRRLHEPRPRQAPEARVERAQPAWKTRDGAITGAAPVPDGTSTKQSRFQACSPFQWIAWPPPRRPVITVSATQDAREAATAASAAVPPASRISIPAATVAG